MILENFALILIFLIESSLIEADSMSRKLEHHTPEMEQLLLNKLFKSYNKKLKPSGTVNIKFALNLNQIINLIDIYANGLEFNELP